MGAAILWRRAARRRAAAAARRGGHAYHDTMAEARANERRCDSSWRGRWPSEPHTPPTLRRSCLYSYDTGGTAAQCPSYAEAYHHSSADLILFEIEDSVPAPDKARVREHLLEVLGQQNFAPGQRKMVTVNRLDTPWGQDDLLAMATAPGLNGVVLAKCEAASEVRAAAELLDSADAPPDMEIWAMIETPRGLLAATEIAAVGGRLAAMNVGLGDLSRGLSAFSRPAPNRWPMVPALASLVMAGRAHGLAMIDSSYRDDKSSPASMHQACLSSRELGFDGKVFDNPNLIGAVNDAFSPTAEDVSWARRVMEAKAKAPSNGLYFVDGAHCDIAYEALADRILMFKQAIDSRLQSRL
jgi:citrate lyase subunit beta/citryl-CoA lyase